MEDNNINPKNRKNNFRINRIVSMFLDHLVMSLLIVPISGIFIIGMVISQNHTLPNWIAQIFIWLPFFLYLNKDFFNAKSPAKRVLGFQIIDCKTKKPASELQCFIRNLTIFIAWPLEVVAGLIHPERRIGDFLANTKVIRSKKERLKSIWLDLENTRLKINFIGILIIGGFYFYGLSTLLKMIN